MVSQLAVMGAGAALAFLGWRLLRSRARHRDTDLQPVSSDWLAQRRRLREEGAD